MRILRLIYPILSLLAFSSCTDTYQIEGTSSVLQLDGKMLFIKMLSGNQLVNVDSSEVVHGCFKMKGSLDSAMMGALYMDDQSIMPLVLEKGKMKIQISNSHAIVKGTPMNDRLYCFVDSRNNLDMKAYEIERKEGRMIMDGIPIEIVEQLITRERNNLVIEMDSVAKQFIQSNYENVMGSGVFLMLGNSLPYPLLTPMMEKVLEEAPNSFKQNLAVREFIEAAQLNMERLNVARSN